MKPVAMRALFLDALYQVLDNWVFRILTVLVGVVVVATLALGFREEEVVLLFGLRRWDYGALFGAMGVPLPPGDVQGVVIETYLSLVFDYLAGRLGVVFCIAASAFFVPQMIEKGAADVLFHKPLSRLTFYLSRYVAGLLFVGLLSMLMAGGLWFGILVASGRNDPGILLAGPLLTYLFGLVYAVSMAIGVFTRSTVASILLTSIFFFFNGCVHLTWQGFQSGDAQVETEDRFLGALRRTVHALHVVLPKTSDAAVIASDLRRRANPPVFRDEATSLSVFRLPEGVRGERDPEPAPSSEPHRELLGEALYGMEWSEGDVRFVARLHRRPAQEVEVERRGEPRVEHESSRDAAGRLLEALERAPQVRNAQRRLRSFGKSASGEGLGAWNVRWWSGPPEGPLRAHVAVVAAVDAWVHTLWIVDGEAVAPPEERTAGALEKALDERVDERLARVDRLMGIQPPAKEGERHLTLDGPWESNVLVSVGSSLLFVVVVLAIGWLRLRRIEF